MNTGMRKGEIMKLKWMDIDFKRARVHLANTKNHEKRDIPLNDRTINSLISISMHPESELVFTKDNGEPYGDFKKSFFTACRNSGIKNFHFHDLRHTFASHLVMNGVDLNTVRELLGHKTMTMTLRYAHLSPGHKKQAVETLNRQLEPIANRVEILKNREDTNTDTNEKIDVEAEFSDIVSSINSSKLQKFAGLAQLVEQLICKNIQSVSATYSNSCI